MKDQDSKKEYDPLFIALTKREGWFGDVLPYDETIVVGMYGMISLILGKAPLFSLVTTVLCASVLFAMYVHDQDMISILKLRFILWQRSGNQNTPYWGAVSYDS